MNNKKTVKTGKEILELYKDFKKAGLTPEEALLFLMGHMQKLKAREIGMDIAGPNKEKFLITVKIHEPGEKPENDEDVISGVSDNPRKVSKYAVPDVV